MLGIFTGCPVFLKSKKFMEGLIVQCIVMHRDIGYVMHRDIRSLVLFVLRFYGPVNPMGSCRAWSVYLTTLFLGRLSPPNDQPVLYTVFRQKLTSDNCPS